jgi:hypothetical protein
MSDYIADMDQWHYQYYWSWPWSRPVPGGTLPSFIPTPRLPAPPNWLCWVGSNCLTGTANQQQTDQMGTTVCGPCMTGRIKNG